MRALYEFFCSTGLSDHMQTFGWFLVQPLTFDDPSAMQQLLLIPRPGRFRISTDDMKNMIVLQLFLLQLRRQPLTGTGQRVLCRFKLYCMWIWKAEISAASSLHFVLDCWDHACRLMQCPTGLRFLLDGMVVAPTTPLHVLCEPGDYVAPVLDFHLSRPMQGGGPVDLRPAEPNRVVEVISDTHQPSSPISVMTHVLRTLERNDIERTLTAPLEQWHRMPDQYRACRLGTSCRSNALWNMGC